MYYEAPQDVAPLDSLAAKDVAIVRPGEKVRYLLPDEQDPTEFNHPTRAFGADDENGQGWPKIGESWPSIMEKHPVEVRLSALFRPVTPFFPRTRIDVVQFAFRRSNVFGVPVPVLPTITPAIATATQIPAAVPSITPTPGPATPTATRTPDCRCCYPSQCGGNIPCCDAAAEPCWSSCGGE